MIDLLLLVVLPFATFAYLLLTVLFVLSEREEDDDEQYDYFSERIVETTEKLLKDQEDRS